MLRFPSAKLGADLEAIDRVIGLFMPDFEPGKIAPRRPRRRYATGMNREVQRVLRETGRPCSTIEIATAIMAKRDGTFTKRERSDLVRAVGGQPTSPQAHKALQSERRGLLAWWALTPAPAHASE